MDRPRRGRKHLIAMVGLPARGKTFTARKLVGYLSWLGYPTQAFNVGEHRRVTHGPGQSHQYFDPANREAAKQRAGIAEEALDEACRWLRGAGRIAVYDATNSTRERRQSIAERVEAEDFELLFIEIVNDDPAIIEANLRETKLRSPDYEGVPEAQALADFRKRIAHYENAYQTLEEDEGAWVRLRNRGAQVVINRVYGYIVGRVVFFLSNLQVSNRPVWLTRHGQSVYNLHGRIGGDASLSAQGAEYALSLAAHVREVFSPEAHLDVWTSTLRRTVLTAEPLGLQTGSWRALDEIHAGVCEGMTYEEVERSMPGEFEARRRDKLEYRYPRGESYLDVINRIDRVLIELERYRTPVLVVTHRAVLRAMVAYFKQLPIEETPHLEMPLHTIIKLTPTAYGCLEERVPLPPRVEG
ncbi:MAG: 6-phosphofructo-2-kinase/fructose-2,6-bisphosphatase [bacterium]|nr:6-phosphofructo-2-kinase/fructose-2,6-bisphosphatase [bacterium]MCP5069455.1 6-phosphofructo-2-kinase/fructose-2,6-bisphosphatase [bacterium]